MISLKEQCLKQTFGHRQHFHMLFFSNSGPKFRSFSNRLCTDEKLIVTYSVTKDAYIRPCISLIRYNMQIHTS